MSLEERILALRNKHSTLEAELGQEESRPLPNPAQLIKLKREKLKLKDEISRLSHR